MCSRDRDAVRDGKASFDYRKGPSFSSTLLEHIYKSIDGDDGDRHHCGIRKKQEEVDDAVQRVNLLEKWMLERKRNADVLKNNKIVEPVILKKLHYIDNDPLFFSSGSNSSDSNSSLFSDHDPVPVVLPTTKTRSSCFLPPKPIRTREVKNTGAKTEQDDDVPASTKSRALKLYSHLKKMKQPISPGVKLTTFINSILSKSNTKKQSNKGSTTSSAAVRPTCSSASSFTRTCLTTTAKTTSSTRTNYSSSVKLAPVNVKIKTDDDPDPPHLSANLHDRVREQNLRLRPQVVNRASNSKPTSKISVGRVSEDARSDCSDDLFELDHLKLSNINATNGGDLPVFETTRISTTNHSHRNRVLVLKHSDCS